MQLLSIGDVVDFEDHELAPDQTRIFYAILRECPIPFYAGPGICILAAPWLHDPQPSVLEVLFFHPSGVDIDPYALTMMHQDFSPGQDTLSHHASIQSLQSGTLVEPSTPLTPFNKLSHPEYPSANPFLPHPI
jgi:hypothetical protein